MPYLPEKNAEEVLRRVGMKGNVLAKILEALNDNELAYLRAALGRVHGIGMKDAKSNKELVTDE